MNSEEKRILKELVNLGTPQSPAMFINSISQRNGRAVQTLLLKRYVETTPVKKYGQMHDFYRPTEKGIARSNGAFKWFWYNIRGDTRNIIVSSITALIITFLTLIIEKTFTK